MRLPATLDAMQNRTLGLLMAGFIALTSLQLHAQTASPATAERAELPALRTFTSQTFQEVDGSLTTSFSAEAIHYRQESGQFTEIDTEIKAIDGEDGPEFVCLTNTLRAHFDADRARVRGLGDQVSVAFTPSEVRLVREGKISVVALASMSVGEVQDNQITYRNVYPGVDLELVVAPSIVRKEYVIHDASWIRDLGDGGGELHFVETLELFTETAVLDMDGHAVLPGHRTPRALQARGAGHDAIVIPEPLAYDSVSASDGERLPLMGETILEGNGAQVSALALVFAFDWLAAPHRVMPIRVDPTLMLQPDGVVGKDSQMVQSIASSNYGTSPNILQNWSCGCPTDSDGIIQFDLSAIPAGAVVNTATVSIFHSSGFETYPIGAYVNQGAWDELTVTWSNAPPYNMTATGTVLFASAGSFYPINVTPDVQDFVAGTVTNNGWRLSGDGRLPTVTSWQLDARASDHATPTQRPILDVNYDIGGIEILTIDAPDTTVVAGLGGYAVSMTVQNLGLTAPVGITAVALDFFGTADRTSEYTVTPDPGNPNTVAAAGMAVLNFTVDVDIMATAEMVTIDGTIDVVDPISMAMFNDADATTTDVWNVITCFAPLCGDCNGDLVLSILDALVAAQHSAVLITLTGVNFSNCNVIGTLEPFPGAVVDILDALTLAQAAAGLPVVLMCC